MPISPDAAAKARFIDPALLARIGDLELVARSVVDGFIGGLHRSPHLGLSIDFAEHRAYMPGDDIRRIDWRVFARTDRLYVKQYEADTNANFSVLLDVSKSMDYASGAVRKLDYARFIAASLTYLSSQQRDRVGLLTFDADLRDFVPPSAKHRDVVLHTLSRLQVGRQTDYTRPLAKAADRLRRRGVLALLSDCYEEPERLASAVGELRMRGHDVIVFHILDPAELELPFTAISAFADLESNARIPVAPEQFRDRYRELVRTHIAALRKRFGDQRIDYVLCDTSKPLDHILFHYLSERERLARVR
ncbi:MAG: DUF58 domain-containing protein [Gammaproteobacteria bacterium]